jgi:hypothetical protein
VRVKPLGSHKRGEVFGQQSGRNDERGTDFGKPGSNVGVTGYGLSGGKSSEGTAYVGWFGEGQFTVDDKPEIVRTSWSAAGCNKPAKLYVE